MPRIKDIFHIINGIPASELDVIDSPSNGYIPLRCPSSSYDGTLAGYVHKSEVPAHRVFPKDTIMVSTNGQGSHTYSYVTTEEFVANSDVVVLIPRIPMGLKEKILYALIITKNRPLFSYGRKPKGDRLANLKLPEKEWITERFQDELITIPDYSHILKPKEPIQRENPIQTKEFVLTELFTLERGKGPTLDWAETNAGKTPLITASKFNNGISAYVQEASDFPTYSKGKLTILAVGTDVGTCFYQGRNFLCSSNVVICTPKFEMSQEVGIYIATLITANKFRFQYGRIFSGERMKLKLTLPIDSEGKVNTKAIEEFIKSLPCSAGL